MFNPLATDFYELSDKMLEENIRNLEENIG